MWCLDYLFVCVYMCVYIHIYIIVCVCMYIYIYLFIYIVVCEFVRPCPLAADAAGLLQFRADRMLWALLPV